jgi:NAD(P)-dependent dehydrogenase (short-subunit alcohol dehydrogenase family)
VAATLRHSHQPPRDGPRLRGSVGILVGGTGDLGTAVADRLLAEGSRLILVAADAEPDSQSEPGVRIVRADTVDPADIDRVISKTTAEFGKVNYLCNVMDVEPPDSSAPRRHNSLLDIDPAEWRLQLDLRLTSTFLCCKAAVRALKDERGGAIVTISSLIGVRGDPQRTGPATLPAPTAAVQGLTRQIALEYRPWRIRANFIAAAAFEAPPSTNPSLVADRESHGVVSEGRAQAVANLAAFLVSDDARHITGETLLLTDGEYLAP